jgi:hypothetical protein
MMKSIRKMIFGKRSLMNLPPDDLRRMILMGENKERTLQRQIDAQEKIKENLFHSVTNSASSERQKRFAAQKIDALERTILGLDRALQSVSMETRMVQRVLELRALRPRKPESCILHDFSAADLARRIEVLNVEEQIEAEKRAEMDAILDGSIEQSIFAESPRVVEILRQINEFSETSLGNETTVRKVEDSLESVKSSRS